MFASPPRAGIPPGNGKVDDLTLVDLAKLFKLCEAMPYAGGYSMKEMALNCRGLSLRPATFAVAALIVTAGIVPAMAQAAPNTTTPSAAPTCVSQPAMTFTAWTSTLGQSFGEGSREYIFADGYFCSDTDQKFQQFLTQNPPKAPNTIVVLNSGGGDLAAGLRMGTIIRQQNMWTQVGSQLPLMIPQNENIPAQTVPYIAEPASPPFPGECASACTLAFMGGINRTIGYASNYGVHQFESTSQTPDPTLQAQTEAVSAAIVTYLSQMGISPDYMEYMVQKTGNNVTNLSMKVLQQLNIVTPHWQTKWQIAALNDNTGFYLQGTSTDPWGTHEIAFVCPPKPAPSAAQPGQAAQPAPTPALIANFYLDPGPRANAQNVVGAVQEYVLVLSGQFVPLSLSAQQAPAQVVGTRLVKSLSLSGTLLQNIENGNYPDIGLAFIFDPAAKLPMRLLKFEAELDSAQLKQFAGTCH
jgi:hypothetical protein